MLATTDSLCTVCFIIGGALGGANDQECSGRAAEVSMPSNPRGMLLFGGRNVEVNDSTLFMPHEKQTILEKGR